MYKNDYFNIYAYTLTVIKLICYNYTIMKSLLRFFNDKMFTFILYVLTVLCIVNTFAWCTQIPTIISTPNVPVNASLIRVGLSDDAMTAQQYPNTILGATGAFTLQGLKTGTIYFTGKPAERLAIKALPQHAFSVQPIAPPTELAYPDPLLATEDLKLTTPEGSFPVVYSVTRKGQTPQYRGELHILTAAQSTSTKPLLLVVNVLDINDYLRAVVPNELPIRFGTEAVKAQAVAARNYAVRPREKNWQAFDICDSQYCQAYYGQQTETPETDALLTATQGLVALGVDGQPALALYSSSHGGVAEAYPNAFSDPKTGAFPALQQYAYLTYNPDDLLTVIPFEPLNQEANLRAYLQRTDLNSFDVKAPHHRWKRTWSTTELETVLNTTIPQLQKNSLTQRFVQVQWKSPQPPSAKVSFNIGTLQNIRLVQLGQAGKAMCVQIQTSAATITLQKEFTIRKAFTTQGKALPSATIVFNHLTDATTNSLTGIEVLGAGFGHGVGMSQFGASRMSELGYPFYQIITHYYPHTTLGTVPLVASKTTPLQVQFAGIPTHHALLHLQLKQSFTALRHPVTVSLNQKQITLKPFVGKHRVYGVNSFLSTTQANQLIISPHLQAGDFTVWVSFEPLQTPPNKNDSL
jgi:SpoIID/LytB domain protein